ncbi:MAG: hypothetical protein C0467_16185 [Planctomycetaceae bacterium]|nr:hypothetical protein [Planctomycetaceae bacterium]
MTNRIVLVSCVKTKQKCPAPARELYTSPLFKGMRQYAERVGDAWYVLSAQYGVLRPDELVAPYERTLKAMPKKERIEWGQQVQLKLLELLPPDSEVIILAGEAYRENIVGFLEEHGFTVSVPMFGLKFGPQLRWLKDQAATGF